MHIYNKIYIEKNNEYNEMVFSMDNYYFNYYFKNIYIPDHKEIKLKPNEYIYMQIIQLNYIKEII